MKAKTLKKMLKIVPDETDISIRINGDTGIEIYSIEIEKSIGIREQIVEKAYIEADWE